MEQLLLTFEDLHAVVPVGRTTFYELIKSGDLRRVKIGRKSFVTAESVRAYVERLTDPSLQTVS